MKLVSGSLLVLLTLVASTAGADCALNTIVGGNPDSQPIDLIRSVNGVLVYQAESQGYQLQVIFDLGAQTMKGSYNHANGARSSFSSTGGPYEIRRMEGSGGSDGADTYKIVCEPPPVS